MGNEIEVKVLAVDPTYLRQRLSQAGCEYLGYEVTQLKRIRIMNVELTGLKTGQWRELSSQEIKGINEMVRTSSKTEEASALTPKRKGGTKHRRR